MVLEVSKFLPVHGSAVSRSFDELNSKSVAANALIIFAQNRHIGITPV